MFYSTIMDSIHRRKSLSRLEQTFMALGQSAATAAVLAIENGIAVQDVEYPTLRSRLLRDGQVVALSLVPAQETLKP